MAGVTGGLGGLLFLLGVGHLDLELGFDDPADHRPEEQDGSDDQIPQSVDQPDDPRIIPRPNPAGHIERIGEVADVALAVGLGGVEAVLRPGDLVASQVLEK